ncbi:MAG: histidine kinase N-terminal 7TM domain-containing protein [Vicinamibacterales bacterium]
MIPSALFVSAALALWLAFLIISRRRPTAGITAAVWMLVGIAVWCTTSALHGLADTLALKIFWSKVQYAGMVSVPPMWLLFAGEYAGADWVRDRRLRLLIGSAAVTTFALAVTNEWHHLIWSDITEQPDGRVIYSHGGWFWFAVVVHYAELLAGAAVFFQTMRRSPEAFRGQLLAVIAASLLPWAFNALYLGGFLLVPGFDLTPLAFAASTLLLTWAVYRNQLFDLVPVARDVLVDSLGDAVIVLDPSRRVLDLNAAARFMAGQPEHWLGEPVDRLFAFLGTANTGFGASPVPAVVSTPGPDPRHYEVRVTPVRNRDHHYAATVVLLRDVTEQRKAAEERDALQVRVQEQQKRESLSVMAGGLAHDFNNLLAGIIGNADLLALQVPRSSEMSSHVGSIILGAQRAADLVSKMLAYAGERHGSTERIDLDVLITELLDLLRASAGRHCTLRYEGHTAPIVADATQIRQVAMNLIINAAEAVDEGGIVTITTGVERLSAWQLADMRVGNDAEPGDYAYLQVRDNGPGMDAATVGRIFNPFFTTKPSGHGLGLAAVQGIVRGHHGALRVDSTVGAGSRFCVWFPVAFGDVKGEGGRGKGEGLGQEPGTRHEEPGSGYEVACVRA